MKFFKVTLYKLVQDKALSDFESPMLRQHETYLVGELDVELVKNSLKLVDSPKGFFTIEEFKEILYETHTDN